MGLLSRIFGFKRSGNIADSEVSANYPDEYKRILKFCSSLNSILGKDRFIARIDYKGLIEEYSALPPFIDTLKKSQMLKAYVEANSLDINVIERFSETYRVLADAANIPDFIKKHNDEFVRKHLKGEKKYLDDILKECDPNILLDDEQREVVLSNEDYTLVIAGAGAGKTTTVAAKVRYLVEKQGVNPEQILVISFTNKAVNELKIFCEVFPLVWCCKIGAEKENQLINQF